MTAPVLACGICWTAAPHHAQGCTHHDHVRQLEARVRELEVAGRALLQVLPTPWTALEAARDLAGVLGMTEGELRSAPSAVAPSNGLDRAFGIAPELPEPCGGCGEALCECSPTGSTER